MRINQAVRLLFSLATCTVAASGCSAPDTSGWLVVDNRTGSRVVITQVLGEGDREVVDQVSEVGPRTEGFAGGTDHCAARELQARLESRDGPVVDVRPSSDGEQCIEVWVIEDDAP